MAALISIEFVRVNPCHLLISLGRCNKIEKGNGSGIFENLLVALKVCQLTAMFHKMLFLYYDKKLDISLKI